MADAGIFGNGNSSQNAQFVKDNEREHNDTSLVVGAAKDDSIGPHEKNPNPTRAISSETLSNYYTVSYPCQLKKETTQNNMQLSHRKDNTDVSYRSLNFTKSFQSSKLSLDLLRNLSHSAVTADGSEKIELNQLKSTDGVADNIVSTSNHSIETSSFAVCQQDEKSVSCSSNKWHIPGNANKKNLNDPTTWSSHLQMNYRRKDSFYDFKKVKKSCSYQLKNDNELCDKSFEVLVGAVGGSDLLANETTPEGKRSKCECLPPRLGLLGGGESSLNNGTSAWGAPPPSGPGTSSWSSNGSGSNSGQWTSGTRQNDGTGQSMSPPKAHSTWAQAAGKGLSTTGSTSAPSNTIIGNNDKGLHNENGATKIRIEEQMSELRIAAAYSEGWGQTAVNQDSNWDFPLSPQPSPKEGNNSVWRAPVNNGTEIWETNIRNRNKGAGVQNANSGPSEPWGHTPSTHIGGTWGEEEDTTHTWTSPSPTRIMHANSPDNKHWGGSVGKSSSSWDEGSSNTPENTNTAWGPSANKSSGPSISNWTSSNAPKKDILSSGWQEPSPPTNRRQTGMTNYDDGTSVWGKPHRQGKVCHWKDMPNMKTMNGGGGSANNLPSNCSTSLIPPGPGMIRLPSPIIGVNKPDLSNPIWGKPPPLSRGTSWTEIPQHESSGPSLWADSNTPSQVKSMPTTPGTPIGGMGNAWDPGSYWGAKPKGASTSSWAEGQIDTSSWGGSSRPERKMEDRQSSLEDSGVYSYLMQEMNSWWDADTMENHIYAPGRFLIGSNRRLKKDDVDHALRQNNMNLEDALSELHVGSNRDVYNMAEMDNYNSVGRVKLRHGGVSDELGMIDNSVEHSFGPVNFHASTNFQGPQICGFNGGSQGFKPPIKNPSINSNTSSLLNPAIGSQASSLNMGNNISGLNPAMVQKILQQQQPTLSLGSATFQNGLGSQTGRINQQNLPSTAQLKHLVQQIQMAVQAGHLNPQILNQPLAPQTLQLLYQLLQQIKVLHQFQQQLIQPQSLGKGNPSLQLNVHIAQTKQRILNLQNQITAKQALFLKQQQFLHQPVISSSQPSSSDLFKPSLDPMSTINPDLRDLSLKDTPLGQSQSHLPHWKNFVEKDDIGNNPGANCGGSSNGFGDFSRAPGSMAKPTSSSSALSSSSLPSPHSSPNLHPLLTQGDSTWSSLSGTRSDWPQTSPAVTANTTTASTAGSNPSTPTSNSTRGITSNGSSSSSSGETKESLPTTSPASSSKAQSAYNLTDLVTEFEPGKPWKGTSQMKNIEDDPHVTPGSVARSPLSLNTIKDSDLFSWPTKSSPSSTNGSDILVSSLTSSLPGTNNCWTFNPPTSQSSSSSNKQANLKSGWGALGSGSDVWGAPTFKTRGPPPGLSSHGKCLGSSFNSTHGGSRQSWGPSSSSGWDKQNSSLILKNLTPQIDGSTLRTLCMQHGPLQLFHLLLNHGIALVRYSTREEAAKAQSALNNCVLGNTTILADIPSEAEVQQYLQLASSSGMVWASSQPSGTVSTSTPGFRSSNSSYPFSGGGGSSRLESNAWNSPASSHLWAFPGSGGSLWSTPFVSERDQNARSLLNSFLPGDLLGSESM
ncbi:protein Gawky-like isoform X3 [Tachypleus tridentatus]|uniref:protein Gawky-like isoform X3 n=1 Tax=Tachypleus tridentatus TaxID=6853 RepID=UPI003FD529CC